MKDLAPLIMVLAGWSSISEAQSAGTIILRGENFNELGTGKLVPLGPKGEKALALEKDGPHPKTVLSIPPGPYRLRVYGNHLGSGATMHCLIGSEKVKFFPRVRRAQDRNKIAPCEYHKNGDVYWPLMLRESPVEITLFPWGQGGGVVERLEFIPDPSMMPAFKAEEFTWESVSASLKKPKSLTVLTPLVTQGAPVASIVIPDGDVGKACAQRINERINAATGQTLPVILHSTLSTSEFGRSHYIAIGNLMSNRLIERLYFQRTAYSDARYPGEGGFSIRTCHEAVAAGMNVIVLGGSNEHGWKAATDALIAQMAETKTASLAVPRLLEVRLSEQLAQHKQVSQFPGVGNIRKAYEKDYRSAFKEMAKVTEHGQMYLLTADPRRLANYRTGLLTLAELDQERLGVMKNTWYMRYRDLWNIWDQIEEESVFTEADRMKVERYYLHQGFGCNNGAPAAPHFYDSSRTGSSHWVAGWVGPTYYSSYYYAKYYDLPWARRVQKLCHTFFWGTDDAFKPNEDATGYQEGATTQKTKRAVFSGETARHLDSGRARMTADLQIMTVSPRGTLPGYGDASGPRAGFIQSHVNMALLSWYYKDGRYLYASKRCSNYQGVHYSKFPVNHYYTNIEPKEPKDHLGLFVFPLDRRHWREYLVGKKEGTFVRPEESFDKLTMRGSWDRDAEYFLMGGIGYFGIHPHEDANAISRYQRFGENWLMDDVYQGAGAAADHCSISVLRNAERQRLPYLVRKQAAVETPSFAYVKSSLDEYGGTDWTRHVLWLKGMGFIVIDDLPVRIPGPYAIECLWRMESPAELTGNVAHSPREEAHFYLANADRSQKKLKPGAKSKPTLRQMRIGEFKLGDRVTFLNTFWAQDGQAAPKYSWSPLGERLAILKEAGLRTVAGIAEDDGGSTSIGDIRIEADTFVISPEKIFLWNARRISCGQEIFRSDLPVTAELDLKTGSGSLRTSAYARVKILAEDGPETLLVQQGKTDVTWKPSQRLVSTLATALAKLETGDRTAGTSARNIPRAETLWQFRSESQKKALGVVTGDLDGDGLSDLIAVERIDKKNHQLTAISSRGEKQWSFAFEYPPGALHLADADGDGKGEVYLGEHLGAFRKISHEGKVLWSNWRPKPPKGGDRPFVSIVKHADIDGDGVSELLVGQRDGRFLVMDLAGKEKLWMEGRVTAPQWAKLGFTQAKAIDLDGDGKKEIYITTGRKAAAVFSHDGKKLLAGSAGWNCRDARFEDVTGDGVPEILSQCGYPGFKVLDKDLKASYDFVVAPKSLGWYVGDIQGDKRPEIVIAASSGYLLCFDGLGGRPWTRHAGDYLSAFTTIQSSNGQTVLVGATDDGDLIFLNTQAKLLKRLKVTEVGIAGVFPAELNGKPGDEILATTRDGKIVAVSSSGL